MAWTDADLQAVETAIATGERRVSFADGRSVEYRSVAELVEARTLIRAALDEAAAAAEGRRRSRFVRLYQSDSGR